MYVMTTYVIILLRPYLILILVFILLILSTLISSVTRGLSMCLSFKRVSLIPPLILSTTLQPQDNCNYYDQNSNDSYHVINNWIVVISLYRITTKSLTYQFWPTFTVVITIISNRFISSANYILCAVSIWATWWIYAIVVSRTILKTWATFTTPILGATATGTLIFKITTVTH